MKNFCGEIHEKISYYSQQQLITTLSHFSFYKATVLKMLLSWPVLPWLPACYFRQTIIFNRFLIVNNPQGQVGFLGSFPHFPASSQANSRCWGGSKPSLKLPMHGKASAGSQSSLVGKILAPLTPLALSLYLLVCRFPFSFAFPCQCRESHGKWKFFPFPGNFMGKNPRFHQPCEENNL